jgi:hypothetical protein
MADDFASAGESCGAGEFPKAFQLEALTSLSCEVAVPNVYLVLGLL